LSCAAEKRTANIHACRAPGENAVRFYTVCVFIRCTAKATNNLTGVTSGEKKMFVVHPKNYERQRSKRTANVNFPVVPAPSNNQIVVWGIWQTVKEQYFKIFMQSPVCDLEDLNISFFREI
jgi:hypothetical protein